jgi:hypothetical protein
LAFLEKLVLAAEHALEAEIPGLHPDFLVIYGDYCFKEEFNPGASPAFPCHESNLSERSGDTIPGPRALARLNVWSFFDYRLRDGGT